MPSKKSSPLFQGLSPAQKLLVCDALTSSAAKPEKIDDVNAAGKTDRILAEAAAKSPELYRNIVAARGEAARIGVRVDADNRVDLVELNAALALKGWAPEKRISSKKILSLGLMID